ncbi:hypothetical protein [Acinetobacter rudis]|uniref:hypothetical protein n=1 Tax=Acinetobacter rudis TaxID=632955 RepID=UPI003341933F
MNTKDFLVCVVFAFVLMFAIKFAWKWFNNGFNDVAVREWLNRGFFVRYRFFDRAAYCDFSFKDYW